VSAGTVSRGARVFVVASVGWFLCWQILVAIGAGRTAVVTAGIYGFVLHMVFGKAYALVPSYFDRSLAFPHAPLAQAPVTIAGTVVLVAGGVGVDAVAGLDVAIAGELLWAAGVVVFLGTIGWTIRDNLTGAETATSEANRDRQFVDRVANGFVPLALAYLAAAAVLPLVHRSALPVPVAPGPAVTHLLAAGTAALLVFALGFRLLPRFLVVSPHRAAVIAVLVAGAAGPALLAIGFPGGTAFRAGATFQTIAVVGFALAYADMYRRTDRDRVGFPVVLAGALFGVAVVLLGMHFAFAGMSGALVAAHVRIATLGFLGLVVVGVSYQFYPPGIGTFPGVGDRGALLVAGLLVVGLLIEVGGLLVDTATAIRAGRLLAVAGAAGYAYVVWSLFLTRH